MTVRWGEPRPVPTPRPSHYVVEWVDDHGPHERVLAKRSRALAVGHYRRPSTVCAVFMATVDGRRVEHHREVVKAFDEDRCRVCGCTDSRACPGGCSWTSSGLCTSCVGASAQETTS